MGWKSINKLKLFIIISTSRRESVLKTWATGLTVVIGHCR